MNANLYEITREYLEALDNLEIDEETGEVLNADNLDRLAGAFDEKAESLACYVKSLDAFAADMKEEEANLTKRRKAVEKKVDFLKTFLTSCMDAAGRDKFNGVKATISFRKSVAVQIDDEAALPADFKVETVTVKPDKTAIKKAIQEGTEVAGATLVENRNIQIK